MIAGTSAPAGASLSNQAPAELIRAVGGRLGDEDHLGGHGDHALQPDRLVAFDFGGGVDAARGDDQAALGGTAAGGPERVAVLGQRDHQGPGLLVGRCGLERLIARGHFIGEGQRALLLAEDVADQQQVVDLGVQIETERGLQDEDAGALKRIDALSGKPGAGDHDVRFLDDDRLRIARDLRFVQDERGDVRERGVLGDRAHGDEAIAGGQREHDLVMADRGGDDAEGLGRDADDAVEAFDLARPAEVVGVDDARHAIERAFGLHRLLLPAGFGLLRGLLSLLLLRLRLRGLRRLRRSLLLGLLGLLLSGRLRLSLRFGLFLLNLQLRLGRLFGFLRDGLLRFDGGRIVGRARQEREPDDEGEREDQQTQPLLGHRDSFRRPAHRE